LKILRVRLITADEMKDVNTFVLGLCENEDGSGDYVLLQRALSFDKQDRKMGMATYNLTVSSGATVYGGINSFSLNDRVLTMQLSADATKVIGDDGFELRLDVDDSSAARLRKALGRIFPANDRPPRFET
jgi:hypothetical protein